MERNRILDSEVLHETSSGEIILPPKLRKSVEDFGMKISEDGLGINP